MNNDWTFIQCTRYKIVFLGDIAVGKTSIIGQFSENKYKEIYDPSIGIDFNSKTLKFRGRYIKLQIWDTAGQEKYKSLIPSYVRGATIIFLVFDITNRDTYENVSNWIDFIDKIERPSYLVLCGNKIDLNDKRIVSLEEALKFCSDRNLIYYEVSAKEDINVNKMMYDCIGNLDCFDDLRENYKNIGDEIEYENSQYNNESVHSIPNTPKKIDEVHEGNKFNLKKDEKDKKKGCNC